MPKKARPGASKSTYALLVPAINSLFITLRTSLCIASHPIPRNEKEGLGLLDTFL